jgi:hypothetical protein
MTVTRGEPITHIGVDAGCVGVCDLTGDAFDTYLDLFDTGAGARGSNDGAAVCTSGFGDGCYDVWSLVDETGQQVGFEVEFVNETEPGLELGCVQETELASFDVTSGRVGISDPCYLPRLEDARTNQLDDEFRDCGAVVELDGHVKVTVRQARVSDWGRRCLALTVTKAYQ